MGEITEIRCTFFVLKYLFVKELNMLKCVIQNKELKAVSI